MNSSSNVCIVKDEARQFYEDCMRCLKNEGIDFLVGGAYALAHYTGIVRYTKDLDLFIRPRDLERCMKALEKYSYRTEVTFPIWLAKAFCGNDFVDIIYRSGNGLAEVDDAWFDYATPANVLDCDVRLCPVEETILSKAFIMERERYDGADILHYIHACAETMDWDRLLQRFEEHWRVLLSHLVLFGFVYPGSKHRVPKWVMEVLCDALREDESEAHQHRFTRLCNGPLLSRVHYIVDTTQGGYRDARFSPRGSLSRDDIAKWKEELERTRDDIARTQGISLQHSEARYPN